MVLLNGRVKGPLYHHSLNLAIGDTVKGCKIMKKFLDLLREVSKLVMFSPKRYAHFEKLKNELAPDSPGFHVLCPKRWAVRAASFKLVIMLCYRTYGRVNRGSYRSINKSSYYWGGISV